MGSGRRFLFGGGRLGAIVVFLFPATRFFSSVDFPSVPLHLFQHWLFDGAGSFVGVASLVGGFVVRCAVGRVFPSAGVVPTSCAAVAPPSVRGATAGVAAAGPRAPLGLCLVFSWPSLV